MGLGSGKEPRFRRNYRKLTSRPSRPPLPFMHEITTSSDIIFKTRPSLLSVSFSVALEGFSYLSKLCSRNRPLPFKTTWMNFEGGFKPCIEVHSSTSNSFQWILNRTIDAQVLRQFISEILSNYENVTCCMWWKCLRNKQSFFQFRNFIIP